VLRALIILLLILIAPARAADLPRVSFEILARKGVSATAQQEWYQALTALGISGLRVQAGGETDKPEINSQGSGDSRSFRVTGILAADNMLHVPGGKFSVRDRSGLTRWLENLGDAGVEGVTKQRSAFGLLPSELVKVDNDLARRVGRSTKGRTAKEVARAVADRVQLPFELDPGVTSALARVQIEDELKDLSCGTALAAVLRPAGLVFWPERARGETLHYRVGKPAGKQEVWPVGWEPEKRPSDVLPALFEILNVEIADIPVSEAIEAIEGRLAVPLVYDRNSMALHGADPTKVQAKVPAKRLSYSQVLSQVLAQARMRYEVREDEAKKPFLWITTLKPAP